MTPEQIIKGLEDAKAWDPRQFIIEACDAAIGYIRDHEAAVAAILDSAAPLVLPEDANAAVVVVGLTTGEVTESTFVQDSAEVNEAAAPSDTADSTKKGRK